MTITASTILRTEYGEFKVNYHTFDNNEYCVSLSVGDLSQPNCLVRIQSSCLFSESFHTIDCDCNLQLEASMKKIAEEGRGVIIYSYEEGRGVGLENKIKALEIERTEHVDTAEAFKELHFELDPRQYEFAVKALKQLDVNNKIVLITNNPHKTTHVKEAGYEISDVLHLTYPLNEERRKYLKMKKNKLGHEIEDNLVD